MSSLVSSSLFGIITSAVRKLLIFVYNVVFVRVMGVELYAAWVAFDTVTGPVSRLAAFGSATSVVKEVAEARGRGAPRETAMALVGALVLVTSLGVVAAVGITVYSGTLARLLGGIAHVEQLLRLFAWIVLPLALLTALNAGMVGLGRSSAMFVLTNVVEPLVKLGVLGGVVWAIATAGLTWWLVVTPSLVSVMVLTGLSVWVIGRSRVMRFAESRGLWQSVLRLAHVGAPLLGYNVAGFVFLYTDKAMIAGLLSSDLQLSGYSVSVTVAALIILFHRTIAIAISPGISEAVGKGDARRVLKLYRQSVDVSFVLAASAYAGLIALAPEILNLYGSEFVTFATIVAIAGGGQLVETYAGGDVGGYVLVANGRGQLLLLNAVIAIAFNITLNYILIGKMGVLGAAIATAASFGLKNALIIIENLSITRTHPFTLRHVTNGLAFVAVVPWWWVSGLAGAPLPTRLGAVGVVVLLTAAVLRKRYRREIESLRKGLV